LSLLQAQVATPFDIAEMQKAITLLKEALQLDKEAELFNSEGKTVKSKKAKEESEKIEKESWAIITKNFPVGKIISSSDNYHFQKTDSRGHEFDLVPQDVDLDNLKIIFKVASERDKLIPENKKFITQDSILEEFEELKADDLFHGKVEIVISLENNKKRSMKISYSYTQTSLELTIYCKILSLTPIPPITDQNKQNKEDK
jgi:hypothetical protein